MKAGLTLPDGFTQTNRHQFAIQTQPALTAQQQADAQATAALHQRNAQDLATWQQQEQQSQLVSQVTGTAYQAGEYKAPIATSVENGMPILDSTVAHQRPEDALGEITRAQWQDYITNVRPQELQLIEQARSDGSKEAKRAGLLAGQGAQRAQATQQRDMARMGLSMDPAQRAAMARRNAIGKSLDVTSAENLTRRHVQDRNLGLKASMYGASKGVANSAQEGLSAAAGMKSQRDQAHAANKAQKRAQNAQAAGMVASLALMAMMS